MVAPQAKGGASFGCAQCLAALIDQGAQLLGFGVAKGLRVIWATVPASDTAPDLGARRVRVTRFEHETVHIFVV